MEEIYSYRRVEEKKISSGSKHLTFPNTRNMNTSFVFTYERIYLFILTNIIRNVPNVPQFFFCHLKVINECFSVEILTFNWNDKNSFVSLFKSTYCYCCIYLYLVIIIATSLHLFMFEHYRYQSPGRLTVSVWLVGSFAM